MKSNLDNLMEDALQENIEEMKKEGLSDAEIIERIGEIDFAEAFESITNAVGNDTFDFFKSHMYEIAFEEKAQTDEFLAWQNQEWGKCFVASQTMYTIATETAEEYYKMISENAESQEVKEKQFTLWDLQHMQGRACQEFLEILYLVRLGFADGAYARWRSMYELCCAASFIFRHGEQIAKQYFEQSETDEWKYIWTRGAIGKDGKELDIKTFSQLQENCNVDLGWKQEYKLACLINHASPQGTFKRMANGKGSNHIPIGHSNYGIATPAIQAATSLLWITHLMLMVIPTADGISRVKLLRQWWKYVCDLYKNTREELFAEEPKKTEKEDDSH